MSLPGALKLTLIIALKTITKQQELADVSGECMVTVDGVMFTEGYEIKSKRHLSNCVCHSAIVMLSVSIAQLQRPRRSVWSAYKAGEQRTTQTCDSEFVTDVKKMPGVFVVVFYTK